MTRFRLTMHSTLSLIVLLAAGGAGCTRAPLAPDAVELSANGSASRGRSQQLPWRIRATVAVTPALPPPGCLAYFTSVIEGTATHLGRFSGVGSTCITDQVAPDPDPPFTPAGPAPYATATFTNPRWTLTAANGDELWLENDAVAVLSIANLSLEAHGTQRIVGGTGRFAGATGEAEITAVNEDGQGPDDFGGYGWIRFDGSGDRQ
jgi:hypothetical protein